MILVAPSHPGRPRTGWPAAGAFRRLLLLACLVCAGAGAGAQTLDEIDVRAQSDARVVRIRFNASVRLVEQAPTGPAELYTIRFEIIAAGEDVLRQTTEEFRRIAAADGLPEMTLRYRPAPDARIRQLTLQLAQAMPVQVRQGTNARSLEVVVRVAPEAAPAPAAVASGADIGTTAARPDIGAAGEAAQAETERIADGLMEQARAALHDGSAEAAIALLNQLLRLPPNRHSEQAQELIGSAWEKADNPARARIEYSLYLKLYPQGEGAQRVAQRLQALGGAPTPPAERPTVPAAAQPTPLFTGSVAQYYYGGNARSKSLVNIATGIDQATLTRTTESSIVTSLDVGGRYTGGGGETRAVVRSSGSINLLDTSNSSRAVSAAYLDHRRGPDGLAVRVGRQSPISGGLLGLFDGISLAYPTGNGLKIDVMGGTPANTLVSAPDERLFAAVVEADGLLDRWGGNTYLLDQTTEGITNRRALGAEVRYAGEEWSLNVLVDYDLLFRAMNAFSLHGSFQAGGQTTLTLLVDDRRAPSLQATNALISTGATSLTELLQTYTMEQLRTAALATSATARQYLVSVSRPLDPKWQAAVDLRYSAIDALPAVGDFDATPATGAQYTLSAQFTGTNLYSPRDINNINFSLTKTPFFRGVQLAFNNVTGMAENHVLTLEPSLRVYLQQDQQDARLLRVGPGVRLSYKATPHASLLGEMLFESSHLSGPTNQDNTQSAFFYVGYRYELY